MASYGDTIERLITSIESGLHRPLDLDGLSAASGLSKFHVHRLFRSLTGVPVMEYVRQRRLTASLDQLADSRRRILDIALDHGFEYEQSYCRAFQRYFGLPPGEFRRTQPPLRSRPALTSASWEALNRDLVLFNPHFEYLPAMTLCGTRHHIDLAANARESLVAQAANRFWEQDRPRLPFAVHEGQYWGIIQYSGDPAWNWYLSCVRLSRPAGPAAAAPEGMELIRLPPGNHAVFSLMARVHPTRLRWDDVAVLYDRVFRHWIPLSAGPPRASWHLEHVDLANSRPDQGEFSLLFPAPT